MAALELLPHAGPKTGKPGGNTSLSFDSHLSPPFLSSFTTFLGSLAECRLAAVFAFELSFHTGLKFRHRSPFLFIYLQVTVQTL